MAFNPSAMAISPDGTAVFVASQLDGALVVLDRNPVNGTLGFVDRFVDGLEGVDGLDGPAALAVAPTASGAAAYVSSFENELAVFSETLSGPAPDVAFVEAVTIGELQPALAVSPDGLHLYVASPGENAIVVLAAPAPEPGAISLGLAALLGLRCVAARNRTNRALSASGSSD